MSHQKTQCRNLKPDCCYVQPSLNRSLGVHFSAPSSPQITSSEAEEQQQRAGEPSEDGCQPEPCPGQSCCRAFILQTRRVSTDTSSAREGRGCSSCISNPGPCAAPALLIYERSVGDPSDLGTYWLGLMLGDY